MDEANRRKKNAEEQTIDLKKFLDSKEEFISSANKVFEQIGWGARWSEAPVGLMDNMADTYDKMVLSKTQKEKAFTASSFNDDWKSTTHSNYYEADSS